VNTVDSDAEPGLSAHDLVNSHGDRVRLLNFGARIASIQLELRDGPRRVTLGYDDPRDYLADRYFLGATVGRYCNRIRDARLPVQGREWRLVPNSGAHQLHGGAGGFHRRFWRLAAGADPCHAEYRLLSPHGDQGYPGALEARVRFAWNDARELAIRYRASTDRPTHVNLSNHSYFTLDGATDVLGHVCSVNADSITDVDPALLPTGRYLGVAGTDVDLRGGASLSRINESPDPRIASAGGMDFNYVLNGKEPAAMVSSPKGDLHLTVTTTCPGLQLYGGQNLGTPFAPCQGLCLETQYFPDSPNQPHFPSTLLMPGHTYRESTVYRFTET
jgi:aldose 1-epimerase